MNRNCWIYRNPLTFAEIWSMKTCRIYYICFLMAFTVHALLFVWSDFSSFSFLFLFFKLLDQPGVYKKNIVSNMKKRNMININPSIAGCLQILEILDILEKPWNLRGSWNSWKNLEFCWESWKNNIKVDICRYFVDWVDRICSWVDRICTVSRISGSSDPAQ